LASINNSINIHRASALNLAGLKKKETIQAKRRQRNSKPVSVHGWLNESSVYSTNAIDAVCMCVSVCVRARPPAFIL
jgi:hypothetical protein